MRTVISIVAIRNKEVLLVKKKETWILPGGKPKSGESDIACLYREIEEELPGAKMTLDKFYQGFMGKSPHQGDDIAVRVCFADIQPRLKNRRIVTGHEISEARWVADPPVSSEDFILSDVTKQVVWALKQDGYL